MLQAVLQDAPLSSGGASEPRPQLVKDAGGEHLPDGDVGEHGVRVQGREEVPKRPAEEPAIMPEGGLGSIADTNNSQVPVPWQFAGDESAKKRVAGGAEVRTGVGKKPLFPGNLVVIPTCLPTRGSCGLRWRLAGDPTARRRCSASPTPEASPLHRSGRVPLALDKASVALGSGEGDG